MEEIKEESFEVKIKNKIYTLREPTGGIESDLQDENFDASMDGEGRPKIKFKQGLGKTKINRLLKYIIKIDSDDKITIEKIKNLRLEVFNKLLDEIDKRGGVPNPITSGDGEGISVRNK